MATGSPLEGALVEEVLQPPAYQAAMNHLKRTNKLCKILTVS
jgi:hypothetical protein